MAREKKPKANGAPSPAWNEAVAASAAKDKPKAPRMQLGLSTRDVALALEDIELPCPMSPSELTHAGAENAQTQGAIDQLQAEMAQEWADFKAKRKADKKALAELQETHKKGSRELREKAHLMLIPVRIEHDFGLGASRYYRLDRGTRDVGELYDTKPMDPETREEMRNEAAKLPPVLPPPDDNAERVTVDEQPAGES